MDILLIAGLLLYWVVSRIYIAWETTEAERKSVHIDVSQSWSRQLKDILLNLPLGKALSLATVGTITLLFYGILVGTIICSVAALIELALQSVLRILFIFILFILLIFGSFKEKWRARIQPQLLSESKHLAQMYWEFCTMFIVTIREIIWWVFPALPYFRLQKLIHFDRYPLDALKKNMKPMLHSAWFSYDLWRAMTFFNERPYPDQK